MAIDKILKFLEDINGYLGAGVFTPQGELLEGVADVSGIRFEEAGSLIHDSLNDSKKMAAEVGLGNLDIFMYRYMLVLLNAYSANRYVYTP